MCFSGVVDSDSFIPVFMFCYVLVGLELIVERLKYISVKPSSLFSLFFVFETQSLFFSTPEGCSDHLPAGTLTCNNTNGTLGHSDFTS